MKLIWFRAIPLKVAAFLWKAHLNGILTKANLLRRRVLQDPNDCICARVMNANWDHLLYSCYFHTSKRRKLLWLVSCAALIWGIWIACNEFIFHNRDISADKVFEYAQIQSYNWLKVRGGVPLPSLSDWMINPNKHPSSTCSPG
ncbi:hypothetical protein Ancab_030207 [Ancistrocladus abbreviatus]